MTSEDQALIACPRCGHENPPEAKNCENCHINLRWALEHWEEYGYAPPKEEKIRLPPLESVSASPEHLIKLSPLESYKAALEFLKRKGKVLERRKGKYIRSRWGEADAMVHIKSAGENRSLVSLRFDWWPLVKEFLAIPFALLCSGIILELLSGGNYLGGQCLHLCGSGL